MASCCPTSRRTRRRSSARDPLRSSTENRRGARCCEESLTGLPKYRSEGGHRTRARALHRISARRLAQGREAPRAPAACWRGRGSVGAGRLVAPDPRPDEPLEVGIMETNERRLAQGLRAGCHRGFHHARQRCANDIGGQVVAARTIGGSALEDPLLRINEREIEPERLLCEVEACPKLARAVASAGARRSSLLRSGASSELRVH